MLLNVKVDDQFVAKFSGLLSYVDFIIFVFYFLLIAVMEF